MANILLDPTRWTDRGNANPPAIWNGTSYDFIGDNGTSNGITATANDGDTISFTINNLATSSVPSIPNGFQVKVNNIQTYSYDLTVVGSATYTSPALSNGDTILIWANTQFVSAYSVDFTVTPLPNVPVTSPKCDELGRTTRTYVSGYNLSRQAVTRVRRSSKRCVVANFNGALPTGRVIASVRWETTSPWAILMSNARIATGQRETMVDVLFNFPGWGGLQATVTLDNGEIYNAEFSFTVLDNPIYPSADYPPSNGPYRLDASV